jgi:hypothetical protein
LILSVGHTDAFAGVILSDRLVTNRNPTYGPVTLTSYNLRSSDPLSAIKGNPQKSCRMEVEDWLSNLTSEESIDILLSPEPFAMPPLQSLIINMTSYSVWKSNLDLSQARLGYLGPEIPYNIKARGHLIRVVHKNLMYYLHTADANKVSVKAAYKAAKHFDTGSVSSASYENFIEDLDYYRSELINTIARAEEFASSVTFEVTLREGDYAGMISRLAFLLL